MKRILIILFLSLLCFCASAQHYIGVRAGYGSGSARVEPTTIQTGSIWGMYSAGVSYRYYSTNEKLGWFEKILSGVETGLIFQQKGYSQPVLETPDTTYFRRVNAVELPLMFQPHFFLYKDKVRFFLNAGVTFSYNVNSSYSIESKKNGIIEQDDYTMKLTRDNRWGYGVCFGAGVGVLVKKYEFFGEVRYSLGFSDILRNANEYAGNPMHSPLDTFNISLGMYVRLDSGKTSKQKVQDKQQEDENKRILNNNGATTVKDTPDTAPQISNAK